MDYKEFTVQIDAGYARVGDLFYITDFRHDDILNKPIRNIAPTQVQLFSNDDLPKGKHVYYAEHHFRAVGKTGKPLAAVIAPYDNTGFRGYTGVSLNIFTTLEEAEAYYVKQCEKVLDQVKTAQDQWNARFNEMTATVSKSIKAAKG